MTFTLTLADVKAKGLAALEAGQLSAQGPTPMCAYRDPSGRPCIIGTVLPDDFIDEHINEKPVYLLPLVEIEPIELCALSRLQSIHDRWAQVASGVSDPEDFWPHDEALIGLDATELEALLRKELTT